MIFRKIVVTAAIACLVLAFTACGDDDSSSFVEPEKESSSSEILSSGDDSVSSSSTNSSSSAKSSSSTDSKSSSSVTSSSSGTSADSSAGSSSSSSKARIPCSEEDETATLNGVDVICHDGYWVPESSSSAAPTSSYFDMTNQFNEKVSYGEFTDPRDGHKYRTVEIYDKVYDVTYTIFAENLNFGKMVPGGTVLGDSAKYCYDNDSWYCNNGWGGLYTWSAAMNIPSICDSVKLGSEKCSYSFPMGKAGKMEKSEIVQQGVCPEGWHIMNDNEWANLQEKSGNSVAHYMGSKVAGFGNNDYGLSILPTGCWIPLGGKFDSIKKYSLYWLPQQYPDYDDSAYGVIIQSRDVSRTARSVKTQAFPVRCVKNY
ncbi:hypothetical protein IKQ19_11455 [Candidatus Saccharibacteria bacterium]|nr:hypothetical protein [Candidatus Saccharibacteria bacterium]